MDGSQPAAFSAELPISVLPIICYNDFMVESEFVESPVIVAFVSDLMAIMRIRSIIEKLGYRLQVIERVTLESINKTTSVNPIKAEPIDGPEAMLFDRLTQWNPALIIIDLGDNKIPWRNLLLRLKSSPATRRRPVVCYGPHVHADILREAENLSADEVVSRSKFFSDMRSIIDKYARGDDAHLIEESCLHRLTATAEKGLRAFNRGEYFDAHEYLEDAWNADRSAGRDFYRALIQVAVAYLQIERANYRGAYKMLLRSRQWFRLIPDICHGVDMKSLKQDAEVVYRTLLRLGPDKIGEFDHTLMRPIEYAGLE